MTDDQFPPDKPQFGEWTLHWDEFQEELKEKLNRGWVDYSDESFSRDPTSLLKEIQAEVLDITGWGMILWVRLKKLEKAMKGLDSSGNL